jgi:hypothetical protein
MARYFGQFIDKLPFVESACTSKQLVIPTGNLAAGFIYPLMGWAYNEKQFIGVYETEMGLNCFQITPTDISKKDRDSRTSVEDQLHLMLEDKKARKGEDLTDEEKEECRLDMISRGNVPNLKYQGPNDFQRLSCELVSFESFKAAEKTADFGCFYVNTKRVDAITKKNKEHMDFLVADYDILCQLSFSGIESSKGGYYNDSGGMKTYSPMVAILSHKEAQNILFRAHSPDMFYKKPQLERLQHITRDANPHQDMINALCGNTINMQYDDPVNTLEAGYNSNNKVTYSMDLTQWPGERVVVRKALLRQMFQALTPSRKPIMAIAHDRYYKKFEFLSRFKNQRLVGTQIYLDNYKKYNSGIGGADEGAIAQQFVDYANKGLIDSPQCLILDDSLDIPEFVEECRVYNLMSKLGGL